jgi:[acyl-carrier-protein] S-malonyltransferase
MGRGLYDAFASVRELFEEADDTLEFPLSRLCFEGPEEELSQTVNSQPAILAVSVACMRAANEVSGDLAVPSFVAGHSLGEYTALVATGVLDFKEAVRLTRQRGSLMQEAGEKVPGGMAAVIGLDEVSVEEVCQETGAYISNINSPGQIVISGSRETLARAMDLARAMGARRVLPLRVSGAFHSMLMQPAVDGMAQAISNIYFHDPNVPIVVNSTAQPVTIAADIRNELLQQISSCVQWQKSVEYMVASGVDTFVEIGPGQVLNGLIRRIHKEARIFNVEDVTPVNGINI